MRVQFYPRPSGRLAPRLAAQLTIAVLWIALSPWVANTQETNRPHPLEPSDTSSPAATLNSLIDSCNKLYELFRTGPVTEERTAEYLPAAERVLDCLDVRELPKELRYTAGIESALYLKEVLDRIAIPKDQDIPKVLELESKDGKPQLQWRIPHTRLTISRIQDGPQQNAYQFSAETVRRAAEFYRMAKEFPYRKDGPRVSSGLHEAYLAATKKSPVLTADTSSPRGTLTLFLDNCNQIYELARTERYIDRNDPTVQRLTQRVLSCLDTSQLPEYSRDYRVREAAVCLKEVLDRLPLPPAEEIPGIESIEAQDGSKPLVRWQIPQTQIVISKMEEGPHRGEFLFSAETVAQASEFYKKAKSQPYRTRGRPVSDGLYQWYLSRPANSIIAGWLGRLPNWFQNRRLGMFIWQWVGLLPTILISLALLLFTFHMGRTYAEKARQRSFWRYWLTLGFPLLAILIPIGFKHFVWEYLSLRGMALYVASFCADVVLLLGILGLIIGGTSRIAETMIALPSVSPLGLDANLIRIIWRVLGIAASVLVFLEGGRYLGFPITTLIASAGIGGLAIALSAQGLIKGLFGTVTILLDKPYRVGDRIVVKGHDGFVEEIGLRSTKIRALSDHLIAVPNDQMADSEIENIGRRTHIRRMTDLHIPIDTPREQVEQAVKCIRSVLESHEEINDPRLPPRVFFNEFNPTSFNIRIIYWFAPPDLWQFYAACEKVNVEIFRAFEEHGIQFSLPVRHSYWKRDDQQGPLEVVISNKLE